MYFTTKLVNLYEAINYILTIFVFYACNRTFNKGKGNIMIIRGIAAIKRKDH